MSGYKDWLDYRSRLAGRDVSQDAQDYDLEGYYNSINSTPANPAENGHLPDTFKKPNHPTFSDQSKYHVPVVQQGGSWTGDDENGYSFTPSQTNLQNMPAGRMQQYFNQVETPESLNLPEDQRLSVARKEALRKISGR
jgi:hypothetical protein